MVAEALEPHRDARNQRDNRADQQDHTRKARVPNDDSFLAPIRALCIYRDDQVARAQLFFRGGTAMARPRSSEARAARRLRVQGDALRRWGLRRARGSPSSSVVALGTRARPTSELQSYHVAAARSRGLWQVSACLGGRGDSRGRRKHGFGFLAGGRLGGHPCGAHGEVARVRELSGVDRAIEGRSRRRTRFSRRGRTRVRGTRPSRRT